MNEFVVRASARQEKRRRFPKAPARQQTRMRAVSGRMMKGRPAAKPRSEHRTTNGGFEHGTGFAPELLAQQAAAELRLLLRSPRFNRAAAAIIATVTARAERCWAAQPRWRLRWSRFRHPEPLMVFFRHWTAAAARRAGMSLPTAVLEGFALGTLTRRGVKSVS